jgi:hypothetical protein
MFRQKTVIDTFHIFSRLTETILENDFQSNDLHSINNQSRYLYYSDS